MQKHQVDWPAARELIKAKLTQYKDRPGVLAREAGIGYFAARRFILNGVHNRGKNVDKLCNFFGIKVTETVKVQKGTLGELSDLLREVWDGTEAHAQLIGKLIESTKTFRVEGRSRKASRKR